MSRGSSVSDLNDAARYMVGGPLPEQLRGLTLDHIHRLAQSDLNRQANKFLLAMSSRRFGKTELTSEALRQMADNLHFGQTIIRPPAVYTCSPKEPSMTDSNIPIEIRRVGNGFIVTPARAENYGCVATSSTMVFQTTKALLAHIEAHFPPATKPTKGKPAK